MDACLDMEPSPDLVVAARRFVWRTLAEWELWELADDAVIVASELVTNAVLHARTAIRVNLVSDGLSVVRVEVYDDNPRLPVRAAANDLATSGRGLNAVAKLATAWGSEDRGDEGKVVWAQLGRRPSPDDPDCIDLTGAASVEDAMQRLPGGTGQAEEPAP